MALSMKWNGKLLIVSGTTATKAQILGEAFSGKIKHVFWSGIVTAADKILLEDGQGEILELSAEAASGTLGPQNWDWPFRNGLFISDMDSGTLRIYFESFEEPIRA